MFVYFSRYLWKRENLLCVHFAYENNSPKRHLQTAPNLYGRHLNIDTRLKIALGRFKKKIFANSFCSF